MKTFFRVANNKTKQGLWYNQEGDFTGLIHNEFNFCANSELQMPFDDNVKGYLSATDSLEELLNWFPPSDILELQERGYRIYEYKASDAKEYNGHWLIGQQTSTIIGTYNQI